MGCKVPMTVTVRLDRYTQCQHLIEAGEFENISELLRFAMRAYYDRLRRERPTSVELVRRGEGKSIQVRLDEAVVDGIVAMGLMARSDICDYALDYYLNEYRRGIQRSRSEGLSPVRSTGDAFHGLGCHSNCRRCAIQHTLGYKVAQSIRDTSSDRRLSFDMGHARGRNLIQLGSGELCDGPHPNHRGIDLSRLGHVQVCPTASFRYRLSILVPVRIHCFSVRFRRCDCNDRGFQSDPCHPRGHRNRRYRHRCTSIRCDSGRDKNLRRRTQ